MRMIELESNVQDFRGSSEHASPGPGVRLAFSAMACPCQIVTDEDDAAHARIVAGRMRDEVLRIEAKYSRYRDDSIVSRINAAAGTATVVEVDEETAALLDYAATAWRESDGLFDVTAGRSEEHTSELQSLMRISYAVFCLKKKNTHTTH